MIYISKKKKKKQLEDKLLSFNQHWYHEEILRAANHIPCRPLFTL